MLLMFHRDRKKIDGHVSSFYLKCWCTAAKPDVNNKAIYGGSLPSMTDLRCFGWGRRPITGLPHTPADVWTDLSKPTYSSFFKCEGSSECCCGVFYLGARGTHWHCLNADSSLPAAARVSQDQTLNGADWMLFTVDGSVHLSESRSLNITPADFLFSNLTLIAEILRTSVFYTAGFKLSSVYSSVLLNTSLKGLIHKMWKTFPPQQTLPAILNTIIIILSHRTCSALLLGFLLVR